MAKGLGLDSYPWMFPPEGFKRMDINGAYQSNGTEVGFIIARASLLAGYKGWISTAGLIASDFTNASLSLWLGGAPIHDYADIRVPLGQPDKMEPIYLELKPNQELQLRLTATLPNIGIRFRLFGWQWQEAA